MLGLDALLAHLDPLDVREVVLETGAPPSARTGAGARLLDAGRLTVKDLERICADSPLAVLLDDAREIGMSLGSFEWGGHRHPVQVEIDGGRIVIRIARDRGRLKNKALSATMPSELPPTPRRSGRPTTKPASVRTSVPPRRPRDEPGRRTTKPPSGGSVKRSTLPPKETPQRNTRPPGGGQSKRASQPPATIRTAVGVPPSKRLRAAALAELEQVLARGASMGASDVLLASGEPVFFRVLGQLSPIGPPVGGESVSGMVHAVLDDRHRAILEQRGSTTLASDVGTIGRVRISVSRHRGGLEGTFRVLRPRPSTPQELGLPHKLTECALGSGGLILIGGGPSSGRSSTLAALVAATTRGNAARGITFEDPVETLHETQGGLVSQREPGPSIAAAVRLALRADVDVVALGELSTREALEAAFEASEAGRRVLAVAAGTSIVRVLDRLIGLLPAEAEARGRAALASTVRAIFVQRLVRSADGAREHLAFELATGDPQLAVLIRDAKLFQLPSLMQRGQALGMVRFEDSLAELVRTGAVTLEAARGVSPDPRSLSEGENRPLRGAPGQGGPA